MLQMTTSLSIQPLVDKANISEPIKVHEHEIDPVQRHLALVSEILAEVTSIGCRPIDQRINGSLYKRLQ